MRIECNYAATKKIRKLKKNPAGIYQGRNTEGIIRMRVLFEGGPYMRKYGT